MNPFPRLLLSLTVLPSLGLAQHEPVRLEPLVITAPRQQQPLVVAADPRAPAQPIPAHDGADALKHIPGFSVIRKGGTDGDPVLRGLAGSRLGVQIDGESLYGGCGNRMDPPTAYIFPAAYDRITVIKGPQTVRHGPGHSAGLVLFERNRGRPDTAGTALYAAITAGAFGRHDTVLDARADYPLLQARVTATVSQADDYRDGHGRAVHAAYERWSANATVAWTPDEHTLVEFTGARSDGEAAYADRAMDGVKFARANHGVRLVREHISPFVLSTEARFYRNYVDHVMDNYSLRPFTASPMMPGRAVSNPDRLTEGGLLQFKLAPVDSVMLAVGLDTQRNEHAVRSTSNEAVQPHEAMPRAMDADFAQRGAFVEGTWTPVPGRRLVSGARLDHWRAQDRRPTIALAMTGPVPNPSAGRVRRSDLLSGFARYEHDLGGEAAPATFFVGLGRAQRFPDYWELIKNESAGSVSAFGSRPETTTQLDAGALYRRGTVEFSVSLFAADLADYLLVQSNTPKPAGMMGTRSAVLTRNVDASTWGGEAALAWRPAEHWRTDASLSAVRGRNDTDSLPLAQIPPLEGRLALTYATSEWSMGLLLRVAAAQGRVAVNQGNIVGQDIGRSPGFAVGSIHASRRVGRNWRLSAGVDNLFDRAYAEHVSRAGAMVPGFIQTTRVNEPGRTVWLKLDLSR